MIKILIIGSGGREHALAWKVAQSPLAKQVFVAPGNAGTALEPKTKNVDINPTDVEKLLTFAEEQQIDLTIVGPEASLAEGVVDRFQAAGRRCFGPTQKAARLESSKAFSKQFMIDHHIPTAAYASFTDLNLTLAYLDKCSMPIVIKADGLAAGKGVVIAQSLAEAKATVTDMLSGNAFGQAGHCVVIEEFLRGEELSFIVMADGEHVVPLASSQDHKARDDGDKGPNTGGMGAYSPAPMLTPELHQRIMQEVIMPTLRGLSAQGNPYRGFLYAGLMITPSGDPKVLEFNCRLGDPETQPILFRLKTDLVTLCLSTFEHRLQHQQLIWDERPALGVVLAARGYPEKYPTGEVIEGLPNSVMSDCKVFHAGTRLQEDKPVTTGGRVLCITALGTTIESAQQKAYQVASQIHWQNQYYRKDIGHRAINRHYEKQAA